MAPPGLLPPLPSVDFEGQLRFSASRELCLARSRYFKPPGTESCGDVWSIEPPDFSLKLYRSLSLPRKKERKTYANPKAPQATGWQRRSRIFLPSVSHERFQNRGLPKFVTWSRCPDALETDLMFVRAGKFPSEPYKNPTPHNFRPLDEDLPELVTTYEKDPGNLILKLKHLDTIRTITSDLSWRESKTRMDTYKPAEPKWDARLVLPQPPWPPKPASYTRHRRRRGAHSAFLDRVEEKLSRLWKNTS